MEPLERIVLSSGVPNLVEILAEKLAPTDLQSLLLAVSERRAATISAPQLLEQFVDNRFVRPSSIDAASFASLDSLAYRTARSHFEAIELAPLCPLGATSALSSVSQNNVVATIRNTEAVSDPTNVMALEAAIRRRALIGVHKRMDRVKLCTSQRITRAQTFSGPATFAHFRVFSMVTAGRDEGDFRFELSAMAEQLGVYFRMFKLLGGTECLLTATDFRDNATYLIEPDLFDPIRAEFPWVKTRIDKERLAARGYYDGLCFQIFLRDDDGREQNIGDGGVTTWTQQLLSDRKERLLISGIGLDRLILLLAPGPAAVNG